MKYKLWVLLSMFATFLAVDGKHISEQEAQKIASTVFNQQHVVANQTKMPKTNLAPIVTNIPNSDSSIGYYIFNHADNKGFVIISADDRAKKILGYSDKCSFDVDSIPPQLRDLLNQYAMQIDNAKPDAPMDDSWSQTTRLSTKAILLPTAEWGQGYPYNLQTPEVDGKHCPTGCVATAMSIVMKYHNWPPTTQGKLHHNFSMPELSYDFNSAYIDWDAINNIGYTDTYNDAVAKLNYMAGISVDMAYSPNESGAATFIIGHILMENFKYSPDCQYIERNMVSDSEWKNLIQAQLESDCPVIYNGRDADRYVGHSFVIDGYDSVNDLYHVNWGWDGSCNGYFALDALAPDSQSFAAEHSMIINIKPDKSGKVYSRLFMSNADMYGNEWIRYRDRYNFSVPNIKAGEKFDMIGPSLCISSDFEGLYGIGVVDENDNIVSMLFDPNSFGGDVITFEGDNGRLQAISSKTGFFYPGALVSFHNLVSPELEPSQRYQIISYEIGDNEWRIVTGGLINHTWFTPNDNLSDLVEVNWVDDTDGIPFFFEADIPFRNKVLRGDAFGVNIGTGGGEASVLVKSYTATGEEREPVVAQDRNAFGCSITLSAYEDVNELYLQYQKYTDNSHVRDLNTERIYRQDGLVYELHDDNTASLIGYDITTDKVIIPDHINADKAYSVTTIKDNALTNSDITFLQFGANIGYVDMYGLGLMDKLTDIALYRQCDFASTALMWSNNLKSVYVMGNTAIYSQFENMLEGIFYLKGKKDINANIYYGGTNEVMANSNKTIFIAGGVKAKEINGYHPTYIEMWQYKLFHDIDALAIAPAIDEITIDKVTINGKIIDPQGSIYYFEPCEALDVIVDYTINGRQAMQTHYDNEFNKAFPKTEFSHIDEISVDDDSEVELYNINGICVYKGLKQNLQTLPYGIYIEKYANGKIHKFIGGNR